MDKKYNGFNNGRDTTDGIGGQPPFHENMELNAKYHTDTALRQRAEKYWAERFGSTPREARELNHMTMHCMASFASSELAAYRQGLIERLPNDDEINEQFEISESSCQDPYMIAKQQLQIEASKLIRDQIIALIRAAVLFA